MKNFLENLRQKNDAQKMTIAFVCAIIFTFVLVASWFAWNSFTQKNNPEEEVVKKTEEVTPMSNIKSQFSELKSMFGDLMLQYNESKEIINAIPEFSEENNIYQDFSGEKQQESSVNNENTEDVTQVENQDEIEQENSTTTLEIESSVE